MRKQRKLLMVLIMAAFLIWPQEKAEACGHEGWYFGGGYAQLFQVSPDKQFVASGTTGRSKVRFDTQFGGHMKVGYDWCGTRYGLEATVSYDRQRLNRLEKVQQFGGDLNSVIHLVETPGGLDFYLLAGLGITLLPEGPVENNSGAIGASVNAGPGIRYFIDKKKKVGLHFEVPVKYTLFFRNNLSARKTSVIGLPLRIGFTVGF